MISDEVLERYSRQILLPEIDLAGQDRLSRARVAIVGCGGLGSMVGLFLAGAGVGHLRLVDHDRLEMSNLHRQLAFRERDIGTDKATALKAQLVALNGDVQIECITRRFGENMTNDRSMLADIDLVIDATDNLESRHSIEKYTRELGIPCIMGAASCLHGQVIAFSGSRVEGCYRCIAPTDDDGPGFDCRSEGVLASVVGVIAAWQAQDALIYLAGQREPLWGLLRVYDALQQNIERLYVAAPGGCGHD